jgi:hypothetical protein
MRGTDAPVLFIGRQIRKMPPNDGHEFPAKFLGGNPFPG